METALQPQESRVRHSSWLELSRSALKKNLEFVRSCVGERSRIALVVKADAYGHGTNCIVPLAEGLGVDCFAVASSYEAQQVLQHRTTAADVVIMGILYDSDLPWVIEQGVEFFVFDLARLERSAEVAARVGRPALVHLELETGGNRTGLEMESLPAAAKFFTSARRHLRWRGLCTHLAGAETLANQFRIKQQLEVFERARKRLARRRHGPESCHVASSAAALSMPEAAMDLVRVGTACYGLWPSPDIHNLTILNGKARRNGSRSPALRRVLSWKTNVMHVKDVKKNEFVGYGTSFQAPADMRIAVIPVGYGNGFPREMSNRGQVLIEGRSAPIVGSINMNMFMVDISRIAAARIGSEVVLVGRQKKNTISLRSFSEFTSALNTEFLSRLPQAIPRVVVR